MSDQNTLIGNLKRHLANLAYPRHVLHHPEAHEKASRYVKDTLTSYQYGVTPEPVPYEGQTYQSWIAQLPEDRPDLPLLIIGAHFDSVPESPGADDNASGTAILLEAARLYRQRRLVDKTPQPASVQFVGFDLEECVTMGSQVYADRLQREKRAVEGMLSLEMLGYVTHEPKSQHHPILLSPFYRHTGDFVALVGSLSHFRFLWKLHRAFKKVPGLRTQTLPIPGTGRLIPNVRRSDHAPFWDAGFPAVMLTDTSFYRNPNYHTVHDTVDTLDLSFMAQITEGLMNFLAPGEKRMHV